MINGIIPEEIGVSAMCFKRGTYVISSLMLTTLFVLSEASLMIKELGYHMNMLLDFHLMLDDHHSCRKKIIGEGHEEVRQNYRNYNGFHHRHQALIR